MTRYAEDTNYFDTSVHPAVSQGEISELLENFGATAVMVATGMVNGQHAWAIRFQWFDRTYRFTFTPLECKFPDKVMSHGGKRRSNTEQARYQMGRIAFFFVKAILTAAETTPDALFGFLELPGASKGSGFPKTAAQLDVSGLIENLPLMITRGD